jgi:hypothetical protein
MSKKKRCKGGMCLMMPATERGNDGPYKCITCGKPSPGFMGREPRLHNGPMGFQEKRRP